MPKKPKQDKPETITGTVENSNEYILNNKAAYLQYIRENIQRIIVEDGLKYSEPMDHKKDYPDFTYTQFLYLLSRLYDEVFEVNTELLYINYNNKFSKLYDVDKVKLCYEVYCRLCQYYGFNCSVEGFYFLTGLDDHTLKEWLSCGASDLLNIMLENSKKSTLARFENSQAPLLNLASANYKYKLQTPLEDRQQVAAVEVLPDLLQLPGTDKKPGLPS